MEAEWRVRGGFLVPLSSRNGPNSGLGKVDSTYRSGLLLERNFPRAKDVLRRHPQTLVQDIK